MQKLLKICLLSLLIFTHVSAKDVAKKRPMFYPFDVTIGGQKAVMKKGNILFAVVDKPVKADALLELKKIVPMLIINAFPVKENGAVMEPGAKPAIYFIKDKKAVKLNATMDKKTLKAGRYLVNIVANGETSRVVFVVDGESEMKIPSIKQVLDFMRK